MFPTVLVAFIYLGFDLRRHSVVLASLYRGFTVLLARVVLGERLRRVQRADLALAAIGILLVTT